MSQGKRTIESGDEIHQPDCPACRHPEDPAMRHHTYRIKKEVPARKRK